MTILANYDKISLFVAIFPNAVNRLEKVKTDYQYLKSESLVKKGGIIMYAVIKVGGKQYRVSEGDEIFVEKLNANKDDVVTFDQVLMLDSKVGSPYLENVSVSGIVLKNGKAKKIRIFKYKNKSRSNRKTMGHRQPYTKVKITKING